MSSNDDQKETETEVREEEELESYTEEDKKQMRIIVEDMFLTDIRQELMAANFSISYFSIQQQADAISIVGQCACTLKTHQRCSVIN